MPEATQYAYDLFISYDSADCAWARALHDELERAQVKCFLDQSRLEPGKRWEPQLLGALQQSRHLVVLWSDQARQSDWVQNELARFQRDLEASAATDRRLFPFNLQGQNATLTSWQSFVEARLQAAYASQLNPYALDEEAAKRWKAVVGQLVSAVRDSHAAIAVPVAVLALTRRMLDDSPLIKPRLTFVRTNSVDEFVAQLGAGDTQQLRERYGDTAFDWRPFGTESTIDELLDDLLAHPDGGINATLARRNAKPVYWERLDVVTPMVDELDGPVRRLRTPSPCLIVIDPLSLFSWDVWQRYVTLAPCFKNPYAAIVLTTPQPASENCVFLRRCLTEHGRVGLESYHDPIPYEPNLAYCGVNVADYWDIRRLVLGGIGRAMQAQGSGRPGGAEPFLGAGRMPQ